MFWAIWVFKKIKKINICPYLRGRKSLAKYGHFPYFNFFMDELPNRVQIFSMPRVDCMSDDCLSVCLFI